MEKKTVMLGMLLGSTLGGYIPTIFGAGMFSISSIIGAGLGGILGVWISFRLLN